MSKIEFFIQNIRKNMNYEQFIIELKKRAKLELNKYYKLEIEPDHLKDVAEEYGTEFGTEPDGSGRERDFSPLWTYKGVAMPKMFCGNLEYALLTFDEFYRKARKEVKLLRKQKRYEALLARYEKDIVTYPARLKAYEENPGSSRKKPVEPVKPVLKTEVKEESLLQEQFDHYSDSFIDEPEKFDGTEGFLKSLQGKSDYFTIYLSFKPYVPEQKELEYLLLNIDHPDKGKNELETLLINTFDLDTSFLDMVDFGSETCVEGIQRLFWYINRNTDEMFKNLSSEVKESDEYAKYLKKVNLFGLDTKGIWASRVLAYGSASELFKERIPVRCLNLYEY